MGESDNSVDENCHNEKEEDEEQEKEEIVKSDFSGKLYKEVSKDGNVLISPIIVEMALAMIYQGAAGETAEKLASLLEIANQKEAADKYKLQIEKLKDLAMVNQIFITKNVPLKNSFENVIEESFKSHIQQIDFSDKKTICDYINQWVDEKTQNKIRNLCAPDCLDSPISLVLTNAFYFKSNWEIPFLEIDTTIQPFFISDDKAVNCEMMFITNYFKYSSYYSKISGQIIEIPFKGKELSLILISPGYYTELGEIEDRLQKMELSKIMEDDDIELTKVEVFLPKFKIEATMDVKPLLEQMGLETIFDPNTADFSGISESSKSLHVSNFLQKTFTEIDEKGSEVAAVPESRESLMTTPTNITFDRPFLYILKATGKNCNTVLLVGKVLNPVC